MSRCLATEPRTDDLWQSMLLRWQGRPAEPHRPGRCEEAAGCPAEAAPPCPAAVAAPPAA